MTRPMRVPTGRLLAISIVIAILMATLASAALAKDQGEKPNTRNAKNVIIMISDGTGYNTWLAGDYYEYGKTGKQPFERFPVRLGVTTFPLNGVYDPLAAWASWDGVLGDSSNKGITESDMAATAMATGLKTAGGVGWAPPATGGDAAAQPNILESAQALGKATGVVTTKFFTDATPAGFVAHYGNRDYFGTIADQMINMNDLDVIMGAGNPYFDDSGDPADPLANWKDAQPEDWEEATEANNWNGYYAAKKPVPYLGKREWDALDGGYAPDADHDGVLDKGQTAWTLVETREDFQKLGHGKTPKRVFGLAESGGKSLQEKRGGDALADPYVVPFTDNVARIAEMTKGALNVLDNDPQGFVAMIEAGGAVDDACHDGYPGRVIEEYGQFNASMKVVLKWIKRHGGWVRTCSSSRATTTPATSGDRAPAWGLRPSRPIRTSGNRSSTMAPATCPASTSSTGTRARASGGIPMRSFLSGPRAPGPRSSAQSPRMRTRATL